MQLTKLRAGVLQRRSSKGFSLGELVIAIIIIGLFASAAVGVYVAIQQNAVVTAGNDAANEISKVLANAYQAGCTVPDLAGEVKDTTLTTLQAGWHVPGTYDPDGKDPGTGGEMRIKLGKNFKLPKTGTITILDEKPQRAEFAPSTSTSTGG